MDEKRIAEIRKLATTYATLKMTRITRDELIDLCDDALARRALEQNAAVADSGNGGRTSQDVGARSQDESAKLSAPAAPCKHEWTGLGEQPRKWFCACGTLVYRSYEDYCDD